MVQVQDKTKVVEALNKQVANNTVLWTKIHNYHWYVKGPNFFSLHVKLEELYDTTATYVDDLAERILAIGGSPVAKQSEAIEEASIEEAEYGLDAQGMIKQLTEDFDVLVAEMHQGIRTAEEAGDDSTGDMFIAMITEVEKNNWMLKSYLGNDVE
jgi:starvation-inducible DNA-binding protein